MVQEDLRVRRSQRDIQAGLIKMLKRQPFEKITINDICVAGMVGRSTFYHHYPDKYALIEALVTSQADQFDRLLAERMTAVDQDQLLVELYGALADDAELITTLLTVHTATANLSQRYLESLKRYLNQLWPQLSLDVPRDFVLELYAHSALTAITWALKNGDQEAIAKFMNTLVKKMLVR